jgi:hypothetical protein
MALSKDLHYKNRVKKIGASAVKKFRRALDISIRLRDWAIERWPVERGTSAFGHRPSHNRAIMIVVTLRRDAYCLVWIGILFLAAKIIRTMSKAQTAKTKCFSLRSGEMKQEIARSRLHPAGAGLIGIGWTIERWPIERYLDTIYSWIEDHYRNNASQQLNNRTIEQ